MWRCFSSGLVLALLVTLLVAWGQGLERAPTLDAFAAGQADAAPPCCGTGTGQFCQVGCMPAKADPPGIGGIASTPASAPSGGTKRLEGQEPTPDPMPPEPSRA